MTRAPRSDGGDARRRPPSDTVGAAVLLAAAVVAMMWANSSWRGAYAALWGAHVSLGVRLTLHGWVNDGLMAVFFFAVGLEIKREAVTGPLRDRRTAALPVVAALGGMAAPALVFLAVEAIGGGGVGRGWAIPMATDIAFAVGVLALIGPAVPAAARLFLLTLAVVDDIGAIAVIAVVYARDLRAAYVIVALALVALIVVVRRAGVAWPPAYVPLAVALWFAVHASGVHPTVAGVVLGLLTPPAVIAGIEDRLRPWTTFIVLPVFALANAGVLVRAGVFGARGAGTVFAGVAVGLAAGKVLGITSAARLAAAIGLARPPAGASWPVLAGVGMVGGIGFTVSLFVAELAFAAGAVQDAAKLGVLVGSVVAGGAGALTLRTLTRVR